MSFVLGLLSITLFLLPPCLKPSQSHFPTTWTYFLPWSNPIILGHLQILRGHPCSLQPDSYKSLYQTPSSSSALMTISSSSLSFTFSLLVDILIFSPFSMTQVHTCIVMVSLIIYDNMLNNNDIPMTS